MKSSLRTMKRLERILCGLMVLAPVVAVNAGETHTRPNIVFILLDDLRWDALGCTGHPFAKTPHIDRIAKEGALFRNFFVTTPLCSPSRASFLTGQYAHKHGVTGNGDNAALSHKLVTFPRLLQEAGYETAYVGKWHMGADDSPRPGFDHWVGFKGQGVYENPMINVNGEPAKVNGYMTDILNEHAVNFVKQSHQKPFMLYLSHKAVHGPFTPPERHKDLYANASIKPPPSVKDSLEGKPALTRSPASAAANKTNPRKGGGNSGDNGVHKVMLNQLRMMASVDEGIGQILKALEDARQLDRTVLIFTSDNGFFWGEHGLGDKRWAYAESIRDPLLIRYPPLIKPGTRRDQLVLNIDIAPTLLELGGAPIPKSIQGRSLVPLFKGSVKDWRKAALFEYFNEARYRTPTWEAVRTDRWKYIHYPDLTDMDELYDLKADPFELKNLIDASSARSQLQQMKAQLGTLRKEF